MEDDETDNDASTSLVNQLTLNFLISKNQLQKLNRKNNKIITDINVNRDRIKQLFNNLLDGNPPDDLLYDVRQSFDIFIHKVNYYLDLHDKNKNKEENDIIKDDIDFDKEEKHFLNDDDDDNENENDDNENNYKEILPLNYFKIMELTKKIS